MRVSHQHSDRPEGNTYIRRNRAGPGGVTAIWSAERGSDYEDENTGFYRDAGYDECAAGGMLCDDKREAGRFF